LSGGRPEGARPACGGRPEGARPGCGGRPEGARPAAAAVPKVPDPRAAGAFPLRVLLDSGGYRTSRRGPVIPCVRGVIQLGWGVMRPGGKDGGAPRRPKAPAAAPRGPRGPAEGLLTGVIRFAIEAGAPTRILRAVVRGYVGVRGLLP
jgi:hypothetical protein